MRNELDVAIVHIPSRSRFLCWVQRECGNPSSKTNHSYDRLLQFDGYAHGAKESAGVVANGEFDFIFAGGEVEFLRDTEAALQSLPHHFRIELCSNGLRSGRNAPAVAVKRECDNIQVDRISFFLVDRYGIAHNAEHEFRMPLVP